MPTILTKKSDTPGAIPATANLTNAAGGAELAVNTADKRLFTITSGSQVVELGTNPASLTCADVSATVLRAGSATITNLIATTATVSDLSATVARISSLTISSLSLSNATFGSATITNLTSTSATISSALTLTGGTANGVLYLNASKVATSGTALVFDGTYFTANGLRLAGTDVTNTIYQATGALGITTGTAAGITFATNLTARMTLDGSGNLGIGTSSPAYKLHVNGNSLLNALEIGEMSGFLSNSANAAIGWASGFTGYTNGTLILQPRSSTATPIVFATGATSASERMRITDTGNLGIGTSSPAEKLDVYSAAGTAAIKLQTASNIAYSINSQIPGVANDGFAIRDVTNSVNRLVIDSSGNLGIGTSAPGAKTEIFQTSTTTPSLRLRYNSTSVYADHLMNGNGDYIISAPAANGVTSGRLTAQAGKDFAVFTNGASTVTTPQLSVDSSGNLGLGVTPSAWSGFKAIDVNTISSFASATNRLQVAYNSYWNGSNYIYKTTAEAARYDMITGQHQWYTAPSGTAGNTISFTQAMTLDSGGRLLIGRTTSDANNYRIQISQGTATYGSGIQFVYEGVGAAAIWENSSGALVFGNDGADGDTERARITSGGYFKASDNGTYTSSTGPYAEFYQSANDIGLIVRNQNASNTGNVIEAAADRNTTNNSYYFFRASVIGVAYRFQVADSGDVTNTNGTYGTISDAKMKTDIVDAGSQWADIKGLRFRKFKMKDDPSGLTQLGVVAQEVEQVSPGLVDEHTDRDAEGNDLGTTTKSVKTSVLLMKAAVALQEAMARIEKLEAEMAALKGA